MRVQQCSTVRRWHQNDCRARPYNGRRESQEGCIVGVSAGVSVSRGAEKKKRRGAKSVLGAPSQHSLTSTDPRRYHVREAVLRQCVAVLPRRGCTCTIGCRAVRHRPSQLPRPFAGAKCPVRLRRWRLVYMLPGECSMPRRRTDVAAAWVLGGKRAQHVRVPVRGPREEAMPGHGTWKHKRQPMRKGVRRVQVRQVPKTVLSRVRCL